MKKNIIIYVLIFVIGVVCGFFLKDINKPNLVSEEFVLGKEENEVKFYDVAELEKYVTKYEVTADNWTEFIDVTDNEKTTTDAFGENPKTSKWTEFKLKDDYFIEDEKNITLKLKINDKVLTYSEGKEQNLSLYTHRSGHTLMYIKDQDKAENVIDERIKKEDIQECVKVVGIVYKIEIPEEYWDDFAGEKMVRVKKGDANESIIKGGEQRLIKLIK